MKLIVGLGNPGLEYENTRHNIGFKVIDALLNKNKWKLNKCKFEGEFYKTKNIVVSKPMTYMNNSGTFVQAISKFYKIDIKNILIIYDDINLPIGTFKLKNSGSSGGQNGMNSIIQEMKTQEISRLRIGIGRGNNIVNHVLGPFTKKEINCLNNIKIHLINIIELWIETDINACFKYINSKI